MQAHLRETRDARSGNTARRKPIKKRAKPEKERIGLTRDSIPFRKTSSRKKKN